MKLSILLLTALSTLMTLADSQLLSDDNINMELIQKHRDFAWRYEFSLEPANETFSLDNDSYIEGIAMIAAPGVLVAGVLIVAAMIVGICSCFRHYERNPYFKRWGMASMFFAAIAIVASIYGIVLTEQTNDLIQEAVLQIDDLTNATAAKVDSTQKILQQLDLTKEVTKEVSFKAAESAIDVLEEASRHIEEGEPVRNLVTITALLATIVVIMMSLALFVMRGVNKIPLAAGGLFLAGTTAALLFVYFASTVVLCDACVAAKGHVDAETKDVWLVCPKEEERSNLEKLQADLTIGYDLSCGIAPILTPVDCAAFRSSLDLLSDSLEGCEKIFEEVDSVHNIICDQVVVSLDRLMVAVTVASFGVLMWAIMGVFSGSPVNSR